MKRYFVVSDVHSFYKELIGALNSAHFDINNPEHILVSNGDLFDRGPDARKVYEFFKSLPKERRILIRGNHEDLLIKLSHRILPLDIDFHNGTLDTMLQFINHQNYESLFDLFDNFETYKREYKALKINNWINSDEWCDYFEIGRFVITHSFIPLGNANPYINSNRFKYYDSNWRINSTSELWKEARWHCPYELYLLGLFDQEIKNGKTLVCGHWHAKDFHQVFPKGNKGSNDIYFSNEIIALDACAVISHQVNVLIIDEDGKCYDKNNKEYVFDDANAIKDTNEYLTRILEMNKYTNN